MYYLLLLQWNTDICITGYLHQTDLSWAHTEGKSSGDGGRGQINSLGNLTEALIRDCENPWDQSPYEVARGVFEIPRKGRLSIFPRGTGKKIEQVLSSGDREILLRDGKKYGNIPVPRRFSLRVSPALRMPSKFPYIFQDMYIPY